MKKLLIVLILFTMQVMQGGLVDDSKKIKFFPTIVEDRQKQLAERKDVREKWKKEDKAVTEKNAIKASDLKKQISQVESILATSPESEFYKQKLQLLVDDLQAINQSKDARTQSLASMDEINEADRKFLEDPAYKNFAQSYLNKNSYSFDDMLSAYDDSIARERDIATLTEQETNASAELQNRKRAAQITLDNYQNKKDFVGLNGRQKAELEALRETVFADRKEADAMRLTEAEYKLTAIQTKLFNARKQVEELKGIIRTIKPQTKISEANIALALEDLDKKKQQMRPAREQYRQDIEKLSVEQRDKEREIETLSKRYNIPLGAELDEWIKDPKKTPQGYVALAQVGVLNDEVLVIKRKKELLEAQLALEEAKLSDEELRLSVKDSFYKSSTSVFTTEEKLSTEIQKYRVQKDEVRTSIALYKERLNNTSALITTQKKALENITRKIQNAEQEKSGIFRDSSIDYEQYIALLKHAETKIQEQLDVLGKIIGVYTDIIAKTSNASKHINFITAELESISPWGRLEHAISLDGIKNSVPDAKGFISDVASYISKISLSSFWQKVKDLLHSPWQLVLFLFKLFLALLLVFVIKAYLPYITNKLVSIEQAPMGVRWFSILTAVFLGFGIKHLISIIIWATLFVLLWSNYCTDPYPLILFYLFSIPYLLYMANRWMRYLVYFNQKYDYCFLSKEYQDRFVVVFSTLLYATIIIVFFREAFILGNYHKSELPTILLAINFIIFQISAILLLAKSQILSLISTRSELGQWIYQMVDTYYYLIQLFLIAVIVMSNPYVGYGPLVLYILKRVFYTAILLQLLMWVHEWFKRVSSRIFFYFDQDDEIARDRFSYSKTWYGLLVVLIFAIFTFIGLLIASRIWHWPEVLLKIQNWSDVMTWIKTPFLLEGTRSAISLFTIFKIIGFVFAGSLIAFAINRFVLGRIFDILLVDSGVQNTLASLIRYLIIITAIILGFNSVGLGELVWYLLWALVLGIGWVIKDPAADLIAYFIIIVQRPIKVGDYIYMDDQINGVVRRITPRSVEIRRKNSTTIVVPNIQVTTKSLANWNHARGFIAFDDILVTIPYKVDPEQVRELLMRVLHESRVVLKNPRPVVRLDSFSDLGFVFMVRGFLSSNHTLDMWDIASEIRFAIVKRLREHGIEIAYPVRIVTSNSGFIEKNKEEK